MFLQPIKDIDICLLELTDNIIETGILNNVVLKTLCLPEIQASAGSSCFTSGINRESKIIDAVSLNLFNKTYCEKHSDYTSKEILLNDNQLCAGLPSNNGFIGQFNGKHKEDFGGPLICINQTNQEPILTGIASSNSLSTKKGQPGMILIFFQHLIILL